MIAFLTDVTLKTTVVLGLATAVIALMRRASAASRHLVWTTALAAVLLVPVARVALPSLPLPVLPSSALTDALTSTPAGNRTDARETATAASAPALSPSPTTAPAGVAPPAGASWSAASLITALWLAGVFAMLARAAIGSLGIRRLTRRLRRADDAGLLAHVRAIAESLRIKRPVITLLDTTDSVPVTWGIVYPTLMLPSDALMWRDSCPDRLEAVLVHELGHVARLDAVSHLVARIALAAFWFHPLVWLASRGARLERERACDDLVLAHGAKPSRYADDLLALVQTLTTPAAAANALAMARPSQFEGRLLAILDARANRGGLSRSSLALCAALLLLVLPVAAARGVARSSDADQTTASSRVAAELARLQGTWNVVTLETDGTPMPAGMLQDAAIVVAGDRFTTTGMGAPFAGTLTLDVAATPKTLDLHYTDGPERGSASLAIYDVDEQRWRVCLSLAGGVRPATFATSPGSGHALEILQRAPTRPPATATEPPPQNPAVDTEMAKLGGDWTVVSIETGGQKLPEMYLQGGSRVVRGKDVTVTVAGQIQVKATMTIDPSKSPKTFEYLLTAGPDAGKTSLGIYELSGDILRTNFASPGLPRPTDFTTNAGDGRTSSVWKRKTPTERTTPNFAGTWVPREPAKSRALVQVGLTDIGSGGMTITQDASTITIARVMDDDLAVIAAMTRIPATSVFKLDGSATNDGYYYGVGARARWEADRLAVTTTTAHTEWTTYYSIDSGDLKVETVGRNDVVLFYKRIPSSRTQ